MKLFLPTIFLEISLNVNKGTVFGEFLMDLLIENKYFSLVKDDLYNYFKYNPFLQQKLTVDKKTWTYLYGYKVFHQIFK